MIYAATVFGEVLGKPRPRVTRHGAYTPRKFVDYEERIADEFRKQLPKPLEGAVSLKLTVQRELPKSRPKKTASEPDTFRPDLDNILKLVMDALNGVAYLDDKQVTSAQAEKLPRIRIDEEFVRIEVETLYH